MGEFSVRLGGRELTSKGLLGRFPEDAEVVRAVREAVPGAGEPGAR